MDEALQYIYYTWRKIISFLQTAYIDDDRTVALLYVILGITILGILLAYVLPIPRRNK